MRRGRQDSCCCCDSNVDTERLCIRRHGKLVCDIMLGREVNHIFKKVFNFQVDGTRAKKGK